MLRYINYFSLNSSIQPSPILLLLIKIHTIFLQNIDHLMICSEYTVKFFLVPVKKNSTADVNLKSVLFLLPY